MPASLVRFATQTNPHIDLSDSRSQKSLPPYYCWGLLTGDSVSTLNINPNTLGELIQALDALSIQEIEALAMGDKLALNTLTLLSPVTNDAQLYCQGLNYADHRDETSASRDGENLLFMKGSGSISPPTADIIRPAGVELLDYEVELGLILRAPLPSDGTITEETLNQHIAGLVLCNDVSARDWMMGAPVMQWFRGKSQKSFCPMGPVFHYIKADEQLPLAGLELKLWVNGELRQNANTQQLIHRPAAALNELSNMAHMKAGDCLLTGTPGGVALEMDLKSGLAIILNMKNDDKRRRAFINAQAKRPHYLRDGDIVEAEISSQDGKVQLGRQYNHVSSAD